QGDQARVHVRFVGIDVQSGGGDRSRLQRCDQRLLVDQGASGGVDEDRYRLHQRQAAGVDQMVGRGAVRGVDREDVGFCDQAVEVGFESGLVGQRIAVVVADGQTRGAGAAGE